MAQVPNYNIVDESTLVVRNELNGILNAILTSNSGPLAPTGIYGGMLWYDTSNNTLKVRDTVGTDGSGSAWYQVTVDPHYLPITGGKLVQANGANANLTVNGSFNNPAYDSFRVNYAGPSAPSQPVEGMLWYDTSVTPAVLRVYKGVAFITAIDVATPTFTDAVVVQAAGAQAQLIFNSQGEFRYVGNNATSNVMFFYYWLNSTTNGDTAQITDGGDLLLKVYNLGSLKSVIDGKQPALGFTPVRQAGGNVIHVGGNPAYLYIDGAAQGPIQYGTPPPTAFTRGAVGAHGCVRATSGTWVGNTLLGGGSLYYTPGTEVVGTGTWRNMSGDGASHYMVGQRVA